jgi:predicted phosphoribosyltransferase/dienelactone hydrolase
MRFRDRTDAGRLLAERLAGFADSAAVVFALPRGGVPVATEVARRLRLPIDVVLVRKLGVPAHPEWGMGAIGEDGTKVLNDSVVRAAGVTTDQIAAAVHREEPILEARRERLRGLLPPVSASGRTAIVVDDGLATGGTARAACMVLRARGASRIVMAVPVAPPGWEESMGGGADELIALSTPPHFMGVGEFYEDFAPVTDDSMIANLVGLRPDSSGETSTVDVEIECVDGAILRGSLCAPEGARRIVVFVHGSGSSRHSPRNHAVARRLNDAGHATLLFDLLTSEEGSDRRAVFDVALLTKRLSGALRWVRSHPAIGHARVVLFGASTGAAAALRGAAADSEVVAVVCRGGRTDLADDIAPQVTCPVLMIVGSRDVDIVEINRDTCALIGSGCRIEVVPGASHLFDESGALDHVSALVEEFVGHLQVGDRSGR